MILACLSHFQQRVTYNILKTGRLYNFSFKVHMKNVQKLTIHLPGHSHYGSQGKVGHLNEYSIQNSDEKGV